MYYGYCRKSTEGQNETSFEVQSEFLIYQANKLNVEYKILTETGSGGSLVDRPVFMKLLSDLKEGDIVGCYDQSRISRNDKESFVILDSITEKKARLQVNGKFIDPNDPQDRAIFGMQSIFANYQKDIQTQKSREGTKKRYANGDAVFAGDLFGYEQVRRGKTLQINPIEEEAKIIRFVFKKYAEGASLHELERQLAGTPHPRPFNFIVENLRIMVQRPIYMGYYLGEPNMQRHIMKYSEAEVREKLIKSNYYTPIIDEELWWKCFRSYRTCKRPHAVAHCYRWIKSELSGLFDCSDCGGAMTYHNRFRGDIGDHGSYYPQYKFQKHFPSCPTKYYTAYRADWLEELMRVCFRLTFLEGGEIGEFFKEKANELYETSKELHSAIEAIDKSVKDIDGKIARLVDAVADGIMDNETIRPKMEKLRDEKAGQLAKRKELLSDLRSKVDESDIWLELSAQEVLNDFYNRKRDYYLRYIKEGLNYHTYMTLEYMNGKQYTIIRPIRTNFKIKPTEIKVSYRGEWQFSFVYDWENKTFTVSDVNAVKESKGWSTQQYQKMLDKAVCEETVI